jgi:hypothetical protein
MAFAVSPALKKRDVTARVTPAPGGPLDGPINAESVEAPTSNFV